MALPAARIVDTHVCMEHGPGVVSPPGSPNLTINNVPSLRSGDGAICLVAPGNEVCTGSGNVSINSKPAARSSDKTLHLGGSIISGSLNVVIGGPMTGGNPMKGLQACEALATTRNPAPGTVYPPTYPVPSKQGQQIPPTGHNQSYNNCGVEAARTLLELAGKHETQEDLLNWSLKHNPPLAGQWGPTLYESGSTTPDTQRTILDEKGVPAENVPASVESIEESVRSGKGTIVSVWAGVIWAPWAPMKENSGPHAVVITGVIYNDDGTIKGFTINDSGEGVCGKFVPVEIMQRAIMPGSSLTRTKERVL